MLTTHGTGVYWVQFHREIGTRIYFASLAIQAGSIEIGNIDSTNVVVTTWNSNGASANQHPGHCPKWRRTQAVAGRAAIRAALGR